MKINLSVLSLLVVFIFILSCTGTRPGLFSKKTPHEAYLSGLNDAGLAETRLGKLWKGAAANSLLQPVSISIPYKETGYFEMENPRAMGWLVAAKRGEQLMVQITTQPGTGYLLFLEVWSTGNGQGPQLLVAADTLQPAVTYTVQKDGNYIIRLQPELLQSISYTLSVTTTASLAFPLNKNDKPRIISFWGVDRDAGSRRHEGIDILVKKRTPVIASAAGTVSSVSENNLGGKVVFLRPDGMDIQLYYAHLDTQWAQSGQRVRAGDTVGLTGNTGNAKNTVSHLHFGIYTGSGAINPLPFIETDRPAAEQVKSDTALINQYIRVGQIGGIPKNSVAKIIAATGNRFLMEFPDRQRLFATGNQVSQKFLEQPSLQVATPVLDQPDSTAAIKTTLARGARVSVLGVFNDYYFVTWNKLTGWIKQAGKL